jgi:transcriptional regulator with PAS, ATPase and Fis domain
MITKIAQPKFGLSSPPTIDAFDVLDLVAMPIHIINCEGQVLFVNKAWSSTYKVSRENAHLKPIEELMKDQLKYFIAIADPANMFDDNNTPKCKYNHLDKFLSESTAISAIKERKKVSMITDAPDHSKLIVTSSPIFDSNGDIQYVMTVVQDLAKMSDWKERLDVEIEKNRILTKKLAYYVDKYTESSFIGQSKKITDIKEMLPMIAKTDAAVLILGESGVGKEVLAKEICEQSDRRDKPFITVNCAAIPDHLIESELFGYEKGAFTGAIKSKVGLMELANGGTILLDEIGSPLMCASSPQPMRIFLALLKPAALDRIFIIGSMSFPLRFRRFGNARMISSCCVRNF